MENVSRHEIKKYEERAIWLESFVAAHIPAGWKEPIGSVMPGFRFTAEDIISMENDYKNGELETILSKKYKYPVVIKAILEFFVKDSAD